MSGGESTRPQNLIANNTRDIFPHVNSVNSAMAVRDAESPSVNNRLAYPLYGRIYVIH